MTVQEACARGWSVIPVDPNKKPMIDGWKAYQQRCPNADEIRQWYSRNPPGWAVITGALSGVITLDFDGPAGAETMRKLHLEPHRKTPSGGYHVDFLHPGWKVTTLNCKTDGELQKRWPGLDSRGDGGYVIFTGRNCVGAYQWLRDPVPYTMADLPSDLVDYLRGKKSAAAAAGTAQAPSRTAQSGGRVDPEVLIGKAIDMARAQGRNNTGFWLACQMRDNQYSQPEAESVLRAYVGRVPQTNTKGEREPYTEADARKSVSQAYHSSAREPWTSKAEPPPRFERAPAAPAPEPEPPSAADLLHMRPGDVGNAERIVALFGRDLRYCFEFRKWLVWDGRRWNVDSIERCRALVSRVADAYLKQARAVSNEDAIKAAVKLFQSDKVSNALREAQSLLPVNVSELDTDPYLLNVLNGTVDLRDSQLLPHDRDRFITKLVEHDYVPGAEAPLFQAFLARIMGADPDAGEDQSERVDRLIGYLQKAFGYSLTGITNEKVVFLLHGIGDNGKSTLLDCFRTLLAEYSSLLQIETLMLRQETNNSQADLADLRGARFVQTSETEEGQRLAEGKLKRITQGMGRIKATRKYENPFEFEESHKLWIDANHLPQIRGTDNAIWNRLHPIPFDVTIPKSEQDRRLRAKLRKESEGILAWAIKGAVQWYEGGLGKPAEVERAGLEWRAESDQIGRFIDACCICGTYTQVKARFLYQAYRKWTEEVGERSSNETNFFKRIVDQGFTKKHGEYGKIYHGIGIRVPADGTDGS